MIMIFVHFQKCVNLTINEDRRHTECCTNLYILTGVETETSYTYFLSFIDSLVC
uniref:Uncharacterized protein n=1 Tax=Arundo donax TaxID=35708 RepID=A0A0A9BFB4_ARUDO